MVGKVTPDSMLSASRLPAVLGLSKYRTPNDELLVSINAMNGQQRQDITNEAMTWGNELESIILRQTAERLQLTDMKLDHPKPFFHPTLPLCCSLDGLADGRGQILRTDPDAGIFVIGQESIELDGYGVLEAKLTSAPPEDLPSLARGPIQLQAQMDIMGFKWGALATLYRGTEMRIFLFAPHQNTWIPLSRSHWISKTGWRSIVQKTASITFHWPTAKTQIPCGHTQTQSKTQLSSMMQPPSTCMEY